MRKILLVNALLLNASLGWAQLEVGVKVGSLFTNVVTQGVGLINSENASQPRLSYLVGGVARLPIHSQFNVQAELLYINKGNKQTFEALNIQNTIKNRYHYLNLPILLEYRVTDQLGVAAGPEIGYLIGGYQKIERINDSRRVSGIKSFDFGVDVDVQYDLLEKLTVGLRYNIGLSDITERVEVTSSEGTPLVIDHNAFNRTLQLSLLYWLR